MTSLRDTRATCEVSDTSVTRVHGMPRPSKGDRDIMVTRPARAVGDAVRARAAARGVSISEYIAAVLASDAGLAHLAPLPAPRDEAELPMTG